jgi:alkylhydroperoxidase family enzyme
MPMPRLPYLDDDQVGPADLVDAIRQRRGGRLLELDRLLLYSPALATGWNEMMGRVRTQFTVPARLREIAMCAVATMNGAHYEFFHHAPLLLEAGGTQAEVEALRDVDRAAVSTGVFDSAGLATVRLARAMTRDVHVPQAIFDDTRAALGDERALVELVAVVAAYNMVSRFLVAFEIEPDDPVAR